MVALIKNDWYTFGKKEPENSCRTSSSWPYDRIRSASSITRESIEPRERAFDWAKTSAREGVAMIMSGWSESSILYNEIE